MMPADAEKTKGEISTPPIENTPPPTESLKPFLLHEEKPLFAPSEDPNAPMLSYDVKEKQATRERQEPMTARVERPGDKKKDEPRVVHYSDTRTPLDG